MTEQDDGEEGSAFDKLRERYRQEQQKRIRTDGMAQWRELGEELTRTHSSTRASRGTRWSKTRPS